MGRGDPTGPKGRDPSESWVQYPNPAVPTAPRHSRWNILAHPSALSEPTLLWAAKGVLCPHVGGTVTHRAHKREGGVPHGTQWSLNNPWVYWTSGKYQARLEIPVVRSLLVQQDETKNTKMTFFNTWIEAQSQ